MEGKPEAKMASVPRLLMALVIIMGVLIVVGVGVITVEIGRRLFTASRTAAEAPSIPGLGPILAEIDIRLPQGSSVLGTSLGQGRLSADIRLADGTFAVWIIDLATGRTSSVVRFNAPPAPAR